MHFLNVNCKLRYQSGDNLTGSVDNGSGYCWVTNSVTYES